MAVGDHYAVLPGQMPGGTDDGCQGERRLFAAVVEQAVRDAGNKKPEVRIPAVRWLGEGGARILNSYYGLQIPEVLLDALESHYGDKPTRRPALTPRPTRYRTSNAGRGRLSISKAATPEEDL